MNTPNKKLEKLSFLIGKWEVKGYHPLMPGVDLKGITTFEWVEGGAFIKMHSKMDNPKIPEGIAVFGSDDDLENYQMIYFDERGVSRQQEVSLEGNILKWWRDSEKFSQVAEFTISEDKNSMVEKGRMKQEGKEWEDDIQLTYTKIK